MVEKYFTVLNTLNFRLYGLIYSRTNDLNKKNVFPEYIYAFKNGSTFDLTEMNLVNITTHVDSTPSFDGANYYGQTTYSVNLAVSVI